MTENNVQASLACRLTPSTQIIAAYRYTTVNTDAASLDYDQQRLLFSIRYQF